MAPKKKVVIWMNQPSYYQTVFFRELVDQGVELQVFYNNDLAQFRKDLGWQQAGVETFSQQVLRGPGEVLRQVLRHREAVHLVNGLWSIPLFILASFLLMFTGSRVYFHAEHPDPAMTRTGIWHRLKCWWAIWLMLMAEGIFVIGRRAGAYFARMGVGKNQIIPFMYFTRRPASLAERERPAGTKRFTVVYVGQFVDWKRVEDLIRATAEVSKTVPHCQLLLLGAGSQASRYQELAKELGIGDRVKLRGPLPPVEIWRALPEADVLVLPSRFDGWGLTVNEALQSGIPAVCSDGCGVAEVLIENPHWGQVYETGRIDVLAEVLREMAERERFFCPVPAEVEEKIGAIPHTWRFLTVISEKAVPIL